MDSIKISDKILEILTESHGVKLADLKLDMNFVRDLDDSVGALEDIMRCEEEFDIEISDSDGEHIETVADLIRCVETKLRQKPLRQDNYEL